MRTAADSRDGAVVVINLSTGVYYSLDGVAGDIWHMVADRLDVRSIFETIVALYDVDSSEAERDVRLVLDELAREGVIRSTTAPTSGAGPPAPPSRAAYATPVIGIYRGMQDLLALDPPA